VEEERAAFGQRVLRAVAVGEAGSGFADLDELIGAVELRPRADRFDGVLACGKRRFFRTRLHVRAADARCQNESHPQPA